jgi:hypothetical protein
MRRLHLIEGRRNNRETQQAQTKNSSRFAKAHRHQNLITADSKTTKETTFTDTVLDRVPDAKEVFSR